MKKLVFAICLILSSFMFGCSGSTPEPVQFAQPGVVEPEPAEINWFKYTDKRFDVAKEQNKSVFLVFSLKGCGACGRYKEDLLSDSSVIFTINEYFVPIMVDDNDFRFFSLAEKHGVEVVPTTYFIRPNGARVEVKGTPEPGTFGLLLTIFK